ncbi:NYN domain-containing protein [Acidovorax sp.]|uniref:NYN domain-containing protein n=1 Tax=Acidovorax sp. TaxID=1872122 RepID=UPI0025BF0775|nr:NYN domain-containing protein [Acidovorax sp.]
MASPTDSISMALFCDFENVALGVRDAQYEKFDIKPILERLLLKGSIVVKKAYCDWERYKGFKATMHEANFELIEIPHVRQSGKNSADIRLVVDALDLCYTKSHVNTFVIISGDSDFSPLVSKLRENNKQVIGVGVKQSTSDLLIANCDEFIFYDDLVRENQRAQARRQSPGSNPAPAPRRSPEEERSRKETQDARRTQGVELAAETFEALLSERGDTGKIWASVLKEAIKRRKPDFSEGRYGFRTFGNLLEEAQARGLLEFGRDEKSGAYVYRSHGLPASTQAVAVQDNSGGDPQRAAQGGGGATRHDFHAVATAPELPDGSGEARAASSSRTRGRRNDAGGRGDSHGEGRGETGGRAAAQREGTSLQQGALERPAGRYFNQPFTAEMPGMKEGPEDSRGGDDAEPEGRTAAETPLIEASPVADAAQPATEETPVAGSKRGRGRVGEPRSAPVSRSRSARTREQPASLVEPFAFVPDESGDAPTVSETDRDGAAAASPARSRPRARKPAAKKNPTTE